MKFSSELINLTMFFFGVLPKPELNIMCTTPNDYYPSLPYTHLTEKKNRLRLNLPQNKNFPSKPAQERSPPISEWRSGRAKKNRKLRNITGTRVKDLFAQRIKGEQNTTYLWITQFTNARAVSTRETGRITAVDPLEIKENVYRRVDYCK